jgi:hypothetical protein
MKNISSRNYITIGSRFYLPLRHQPSKAKNPPNQPSSWSKAMEKTTAAAVHPS